MNAIGLIIGHGYAKACCGVRTVRFPAVAAPASARSYESAVGQGPTPISVPGSGEWLVGEEAQTFAPQRLVSILDRTRYRDPSFRALAQYAIAQVAPEPGPRLILTGMPAAWFADPTAQADLTHALRSAAAPWGEVTTKLVPEAAGVFYAFVFESGRLQLARTRGAIGVVDAGYRDVNVALFVNGRYVTSESIPGGMVAALRAIKQLIAQAYGLELAEHQVDAMVRAGAVRVAGTDRPLPPGTHAEIHKSLGGIVSAGRAIWPNGGKTLDALVLGGGGAIALGPALVALFPQTVVPYADIQHIGPPPLNGEAHARWTAQLTREIAEADPQMAGARGLAAIAATQVLQVQP